ncbi:MAG: phosphoglycerate kinase [Candidatus Korarchaeota archaeon]|nr:phosphoglycerate kinase [Thermoproteota archaeon]
MPTPLMGVFDISVVKPNRPVICRLDINSPIKKREDKILILDRTRLESHKETITTLIENGNKIILLAHQGRPGDDDFTSLKFHAEMLGEILGHEVKFVDDIIGKKACEAVEKLKHGEVLLLENVRFLEFEQQEKSPEEHAKSPLVQTLGKYADFFVLDGFAVAHRSHASVVGFAPVLPSAMGLLMEKEIKSLSMARENAREYILILGGAKLPDALKYIKKFLKLERTSKILLTGLIALAFHMAKGYKIPSNTEKLILDRLGGESIIEIKKLANNEKIVLPIDYGVEINGDRINIPVDQLSTMNAPPKDIGPETIKYYLDIVGSGRVILMKGPAGVIEDEKFVWGSENLLRELFKMNNYVILLGGHLVSVLDRVGDSTKHRRYFISTGGGASVEFFIEGTLPGLEALKLSYKIFSQR